VVAEQDDVAADRIPQRVRIPGLNQLVAPRTRQHDDEEPVVVADRFVDPDLVDEGVRLDAFPQVLSDRVVHRGNRPARRHETPVFIQAESPDAEGPLDFRNRQAAVEEAQDGLLRAEVRVGRGPVEVRIDAQVPDVEPLERGGGAERLNVVVEDDPAMRLTGEAHLDIRWQRAEGQFTRLVDDPSPAVDVLDVDAMHPADQGRAKADDILHRMADPRFRGIEDLRIAMDRRHQGTDEHLGISETADEHARRRRAVQFEPVNHRRRLHHRILLYFSDFRNLEERYVLPQATTQKAIAFAAGIQRKHLSRYLDEMVRDGYLTETKAHIEGEKQRMLAYYLAPRGWERAMSIRERLSKVKVPVTVAGVTRDMTLEEIDHATSVHLTLSDIVREAMTVDK